MKPFTYERATSVEHALTLGARPGTTYLGGGTNLVDLMREGIERPDHLVDVSRLSCDIDERPEGGTFIGAGVSNARLAADPGVLRRHPLVASAILNGASGQIRNTATVAGNILQRTRCPYFYDAEARCNKRVPGSGCDARGGETRGLSILGASEHCAATHPSDLCVALVALDACLHVARRGTVEVIPLADVHLLPGRTPDRETVIGPGELVLGVEIPPHRAAPHEYRKVRDRASFAFSLVSVGALLEVVEHRITFVRIALGGVAPKPWRVLEAERSLVGGSPSAEAFVRAATLLLEGASPLEGNAFKVHMAHRLVRSTLADLALQGRQG